jgi:succinate dehydrogenase / fumarate reductase cytochrome b subunit
MPRATPEARRFGACKGRAIIVSTAGANIVVAADAAAGSRLARFASSSIGQKVVMATTGVVLSGFVLAHMAGNLNAFRGQEALDAYGAALRHVAALLWGVRITLLVAVLLHIWAYLALTRRSLAARPQGYRVAAHRESSYASRSMRYTGPIVLVFIVFHLLHMTTGTVHPSFVEGAVYHNLITGLRVVPVALFYLVALAGLAFHLFHGVWSIFQSLGLSQPRYGSVGRAVATVFTLVVIAGFAAVPLSVLAGILK